MNKKIQSALISVFYKEGLETLVQTLHKLGVAIYTTGGTQQFIEKLGIPCIAVESVTEYPSILGGRVKTLHPKMFGGILGRRNVDQDLEEMKQYGIPELDLVIVDLYPFKETLASTNEEALIIEKIDIGGPSMIRAAAKNYRDVTVLASKDAYQTLNDFLIAQEGTTTLEQRKYFAANAFEVVMQYDIAISNYFNTKTIPLRYGENPHQQAHFIGHLEEIFTQLHGKELSYNNLVDVDAAFQLIHEFKSEQAAFFAIIKHTNVCGAALRPSGIEAWQAALAGDPESAFGGVLVCNAAITKEIAEAIHEIFFEVLIANDFDQEALDILQQKKNRILLKNLQGEFAGKNEKSILNGTLTQEADQGNFTTWTEEGGRTCTEVEKQDAYFANALCKHLKSNAIAIVKDRQMIGKGCGQTSRIDALKQAIEKAAQFHFELKGAVLASDAFFPFDDCVKIAHAQGITVFIQPGGSIRDKDSIQYCKDNNLAMVITGMRHFKH
ncbi:MAG: bifunctional phosphoribosylaminoimidazolecarboxamide formyltransferase/IMP cyclohydrolase [Bacteroidetes bacterium]|nr:bifunctional phosphoribosylaminoimidazolecarboxamide formyltransferase/IMP cyclohydrolase [Bacteroidota bacterium]MBP6314685.1 bifunctional phosphoribosylaminoimidazolecarboxamide formyltransferase/IMP cyclohydrolase [Chitinophagaceae bacterium]